MVLSIELQQKRDLESFQNLKWDLRIWDYWHWSNCDPRFGDDLPVRIPSQLIAHLLFYFSEPGHLTIDPMGGGGVTTDTCLVDIDQHCGGIGCLIEGSPDVIVGGQPNPSMSNVLANITCCVGLNRSINEKSFDPTKNESDENVTDKAIEEKELCPFCGKEKHDFMPEPGNNKGNGQELAANIFQHRGQLNLADTVENHPWYAGRSSLAAHHLICTEAMNTTDWKTVCENFGYDINHHNNGVLLPMKMKQACHLKIPLHRGSHRSTGTNLDLTYPAAVSRLLNSFYVRVQRGGYCDNQEGVINALNTISGAILEYINRFLWTLTSDGLDYKNESSTGCGGVDSIAKKAGNNCPHNRNHQNIFENSVSDNNYLTIGC